MVEGIHEGSATTHGEACNSPVLLFSLDPVCFFHERHELFKKEIFIPPLIFQVVKVPNHTSIGIWHYYDHGCCRAIIHGLVCNTQHLPELYPSGLVITHAMQQVENRVTTLGGLIVGWQVNCIVTLHVEDIAVHGKIVEYFPVLCSEYLYGSQQSENQDCFFHDSMVDSFDKF